jgi:Uncharacterized protein involved in tolerance to divalent cations
MSSQGTDLLLGWTTVSSESQAQDLAHALVEAKLAVCVQIDGPVHSVYRWEGKLCAEDEWRLLVKFVSDKSEALEAYLMEVHPYDTPEWVVVRPEHVSDKYLAWACEGL